MPTDLLANLEIEGAPRLADYTSNGNGHGPKYQTTGRKVAIVGFAPPSMRPAFDLFFKNPDWSAERGCEIWGLNELYKVDPCVDAHWDRWFDIHDPRSSVSTRDADNVKWLSSQTKPIYMTQHFADIPASVPYPLRDIIRYWGSDYLTNTISMMVLLAAMEGRHQDDEACVCEAKPCHHPDGLIHRRGAIQDASKAFGEIHLYGVDMAQDSEYMHQRPSCEAAVCFARGLGIKVYIPPTSDLMKIPFIYGYEGDGQALRQKMDIRIKDLKQQAKDAKATGENARRDTVAMVAVANEMAAIINRADRETVASPVVDWLKQRIAELQPEIQKANNAAEQYLMRAAMLDGAEDDALYWRRNWTGA